MAKFHNYYVLCPLIDQKSFLGVSQDKEDECLLVTLGRNVVNKYRLSDQKQIGGWTSKDHITSTIIYDRDQDNYVGVFNNNSIKIWKENLTNLDKVKKRKFPVNILKLLPRENQSPLVIFNDGNCTSLPHAIETRKAYENKNVIKNTDIIVDVAFYTNQSVDYICYIIKSSKDLYEIVNCPLKVELAYMETSKLSKVKIIREDAYVVGKLICVDKFAVHILWSDSKLTVYDLTKKLWRTVGTVPWITTLPSVSLSQLGETHLIMFGSNLDQDGAILVAYNTDLGVGSCKYPMKMYSENAKLYCFNNRVILEASNHIGVLPYILEPKRNLSSLLGSHEEILDEQVKIADWGTPTKPLFPVNNQLKTLAKAGLTERNICGHTISSLLDKNETLNTEVLKKFMDIPESTIVSVLKYGIRQLESDLSEFSFENNIAIGSRNYPVKKQEHFEFINYILQLSFSDAMIIPYLRNTLDLDESLFLLSYISYLIVNEELEISMKFESKLYDWCMLIIDAYYQEYLIKKEEKVTKVLQNTLDIVIKMVKCFENINSVMPKLKKLLTNEREDVDDDTHTYVIELMDI